MGKEIESETEQQFYSDISQLIDTSKRTVH